LNPVDTAAIDDQRDAASRSNPQLDASKGQEKGKENPVNGRKNIDFVRRLRRLASRSRIASWIRQTLSRSTIVAMPQLAAVVRVLVSAKGKKRAKSKIDPWRAETLDGEASVRADLAIT
jgi:hypothetical protein